MDGGYGRAWGQCGSRRVNGNPATRSLALVAALLSMGFLGGCSGLVNGTKSAIEAAFQLGSSSLNFGKVTVGKQSTQTVSVSNTGNTSISITQATFSNSQFSLSGTALPMSLGTGQSANMTVAFAPTTSGSANGTMTVQGSDGSSPATVSLSATAASSGPEISLSTTSVEFGSVSVGSTGNGSVTISNLGSADLNISLIAVTGATFGETGIATPKTISAGSSATMSLSFHPTASGDTTGNVTITSNDPVNPTTVISLDGTGSSTAQGQLQANPTTVSFGNVAVGSNATQKVTLTNTGTTSVQISTMALTGAGVSVSGIAFPVTLAASASTSFNVVFAPTASAAMTGSVSITSNASGSPLVVPVSGTGVQGGLSISSSSYAFGSVVDGQTKSQNFTLTNTGTASLTISQLSMTGTGFSISGLTTPATLTAGASTSLSAVFAPTTGGNFSGSISISSNAPNSPATISLTGTGVASSVTLSASPTSVSFGSVNAGSSSTSSVKLTNSGNSNLTISQVTVSAKDVTDSGLTLPVTLTPGQSQTMSVKFSPTAAETVNGNITVTSSQGANAVITVSGTGLQAGISLTPSSASFGNVTVGAANSQTIQISNTGNATLTITQASVTGTGFSTAGLSLPLSINPGQTSTFNAEFQPAAAGSASGSISLVSNAAGSPTGISLTGTGIAATETLSFSTTSVSFGNVNTGSSASQGVTITNTGNASVQISQIAVSGTGYSLTGASAPVTLSASQTLTFNVVFDPASAGSASGSVVVTSNATGSPATITLSGTGVQATPHTVALSWTASTSTVSGYNVYRSTTSGSGYSKLNASLVSNVNYTDSTVQNGATYYYVTTAVDSSGDESSYSNEASAVIP
jgi:Abnormal spindle-like microcephaly-assoc'd, ASPM-SPD-2-Hydin/Protein of unknown function (DUF1573)